MPTLVRRANAKIRMSADDHMPPHLHLYGPRSNALIATDTLEVIRGRADRRDLAELRAWAEPRRAMLMAEWRRLNARD